MYMIGETTRLRARGAPRRALLCTLAELASRQSARVGGKPLPSLYDMMLYYTIFTVCYYNMT